jgi:type IV secretory pathway VirB4 component
MSNLANKTERKALQLLANTLRFFEETANLKMTANDAFQAREAENMIKGIIENNGFSANYEKGKGTRLTKFKN